MNLSRYCMFDYNTAACDILNKFDRLDKYSQSQN